MELAGSTLESIPPSLADLPGVGTIAEAAGQDTFLEIFSGDCVLTLAMSLTDLQTILPWDLRFGAEFDVLEHGDLILQKSKAGALSWVHLGTPCQTFTWARRPQLRSTVSPFGLSELSRRQLKLVARGNELALFSLEVCQCQVKSGNFFSIENPELSWLWILPPMIQLRRSQGVSTVRVLFSDFQVPFRKPTVFVHNSECLHELAKSESSWHGRTIKLRGLAKYDGKLQFRTRLAQSYPPLLCIKFAGLVRETVVNMRERGDWDGWASGVGALSFQLPDCLRIAEAEVVANCCGDWMFVPHGLGAMKGLSPLEHVAFSLSASHPSESRKQLEETLKDAIEFECGHEVGEIDEFRCFRLNQFLRLHASLQQEHLEWVRQAPTELQGHAAKIHGPLWKVVLQQCGIPCERFLHDLQFGFPLVGHLAPCEGESVACQFEAAITVDELVNGRRDINERVIASVRELPFSSDILSQALQDSAQGFMSTPRAFTPHDASHLSLTRRIPVREERSKGWRTRVVDHSTESMVNAATVPCDRIKHHTLDDLADMVMCFFESNCQVSLWKVDISQAFRRVPIKSEHMQFAWTVWMHLGCLLVAQHTGMPFGTVSAVYAWHRVGFMLCHVVRVLFLCPAARYVDDFFGASRRGVRWNAGRVLAVICKLLGFPVDDDKSAEDDIRLVILGAECEIDWPRRQLRTCVAPAKAAKYRCQLLGVIAGGVLAPGDASKLAGRLSFAVTVSGNRVGRAFIKPFHAQANQPLFNNAVSPLLRQACSWFLQYLEHCPTSVRLLNPLTRSRAVSWTDASGESRWVAAVLYYEGTFFWTRVRTPENVWQMLIQREDHQIGFQEFLGVLLAWTTFKGFLQGSLWIAFVDNDSVLHAITKASGGTAETSLCIGRLWLEIAVAGVDLHMGRVESAANVADGPTRDSFRFLADLKATWVEPKLPLWLESFWEIPSAG